MQIRYRAWDGTQQPSDVDGEALLEAMGDDLLEDGDLWSALRRLFRQGARNREGQRLPGLQDLLRQVREERQRHLQQSNLNDTLGDIRRQLEQIQQTERAGIDRRVDDGHHKVQQGEVPEKLQQTLERMAQEHRAALDQLPPEVPGQIQALQEYDFMDPNARQQFQELMEQLRQMVMQQQFQGLQQGLNDAKENMNPATTRALKEMLGDLNRMLEERAQGGQPDFSAFKEKWGELFPGINSLDELVEHLQRQQAQMQSLMDSMSADQRRELQQMMQSLVQDPGLREELAMLAANLEELRPMHDLRRRYPFRGEESIPLDQAMQTMQELQELDRLERQMREAIESADPSNVDRESLRRQLGDQAAEELEQLSRVAQTLEDAGLVQRVGDRLELTPRALRKIGQKALRDIFQNLKRDRFGNHAVDHRGSGGDRTDETKRYEFGDPFLLDLRGTLQRSLERNGRGTPLTLEPSDFEVFRTEHLNQASTVLLLDLSRSMIYRGCFLAAKKVALALHSLIKNQFPRDNLDLVTFSLYARTVQPEALTALRWSEWEYGTNLQDGLMHARKLLNRHKGGTRQIIVITDGEPTAYWEPGRAEPIFSYPPTARTIQQTLLEVGRCTRDGIRINTFMLDRSYGLMRFVDEITRINRGRAFFADPEHLGDYILVDYLAQKTRHVA